MAFAASSIRLTASAVEMSGSGSPFRTATTMGTVAKRRLGAGHDVAGGQHVLIGRLHDRHIEGLAAHNLLMRGPAGSDGDLDLETERALELRRQPVQGTPHAAGRDERDLLRQDGVRLGHDQGENG